VNGGGGSRRGIGETTSKTVETLRVEVGQRGADSANILGFQGSTHGCGEYGGRCAVCIVCIVDIDARSFFGVLLAHLGGGELWESGRIAWSAGSGKTLRGLSCIYTDVHRYDVIKWRGNVKRFFEHPRMSERMRAKAGIRSRRTS